MNINFNDVERLINIAERANIDSLEVVDGSKRISIICQSPFNQSGNQDRSHINSRNSSTSTDHTSTNSFTNPNDNSSAQDIDSAGAAKDKPTTETASENNQITAPMLGTFYRRSDPSADVFVSVGDSVVAGDTLCVIEAMKIMHEVKADRAGSIEEILVEDGDVVEFDQALFMISPS
ncbi:acetyl-CoA carboxylase biotin carboxyl carrier protein subunit [Psychrobacter sp. Ps3]|uniref:acetyl-CoA carboxylase biotin carboxyl carrier protein n=1 Tax=Psychrobacter sp. Ps3 TaxID=2790957 RepID=UPI001EDDC1C6|nr:acetyl-CoA carboxylase biotin carboxyl carrier protein subunit [Psychrobacter sp. Ps3]MCG3883048.1 acetyl-CoA carboxylase, biotin carboxyl carrier protein [Psychrobacter sp. Ps3]